jgi:hypothetical protein
MNPNSTLYDLRDSKNTAVLHLISSHTFAILPNFNQQNELIKYSKTNHKIHFILGTISYIFRQKGAIFRVFINNEGSYIQHELNLESFVVNKLPHGDTLLPKSVGVGTYYEVYFMICFAVFYFSQRILLVKIENVRKCTVRET